VLSLNFFLGAKHSSDNKTSVYLWLQVVSETETAKIIMCYMLGHSHTGKLYWEGRIWFWPAALLLLHIVSELVRFNIPILATHTYSSSSYANFFFENILPEMFLAMCWISGANHLALPLRIPVFNVGYREIYCSTNTHIKYMLLICSVSTLHHVSVIVVIKNSSLEVKGQGLVSPQGQNFSRGHQYWK